MSDLRTNYTDDELAVSMEGKRKFNIVDSQGNVVYANVHIEDVSSYSNIGDEYGAAQINEQNQKINEINTHLISIKDVVLPTVTANTWINLLDLNNYGITDFEHITVQYTIARPANSDYLKISNEVQVKVTNAGILNVIFTNPNYTGLKMSFVIANV